MDVMNLRRGLLVKQKIQCPYITDGLIFWLDGITKGNDPTKWVDLIGKKKFNLENCSFDSNGVVFASGSIGTYEGAVGTGAYNDTIETVAISSTSQYGGIANSMCIFSPDNSNGDYIGMLRGAGTNGTYIMNGSQNKRILIAGYPTISANSSYFVENKTQKNFGSNDSWGKNTSGFTILGNRTLQKAYHFTGTLHCIRIYNRHLTVDEMIANQAIDFQRFGLGT